MTSTCANCHRERPTSDTFLHAEDRVVYCADVLACEARLTVRVIRGDFDGPDWVEADMAGATVSRRKP